MEGKHLHTVVQALCLLRQHGGYPHGDRRWNWWRSLAKKFLFLRLLLPGSVFSCQIQTPRMRRLRWRIWSCHLNCVKQPHSLWARHMRWRVRLVMPFTLWKCCRPTRLTCWKTRTRVLRLSLTTDLALQATKQMAAASGHSIWWTRRDICGSIYRG